jgi:Tol biopolymer transport system component
MKNKKTLLIAAAVALAVLYSGCGKKQSVSSSKPVAVPTALPSMDKIVFTYNGYLFWMDPDGNAKQEIFPDKNSKWFPCVSPNGWYVSYWVQANGSYNLWVGDFRTTKAGQITFDEDSLEGDMNNLKMNNPGGWTADSENIIYARHRDIWKIGRDGYNPAALSDSHNCISPSVSKDGKLAYSQIENENTSNLYIKDMTSLVGEKLTSFTGKRAGSPAFSPDGKKLVFTLSDQETVDIYIYDIAAKKSFPISIDGRSHSPVFSFDGNKIIFASFLNDKYQPEIWSMNADGTDRRKLTSDGGVSPSWLHRVLAEPLPTYTPTAVMQAPSGNVNTVQQKNSGNTITGNQQKTPSQPAASIRTVTAAPIKAVVINNKQTRTNILSAKITAAPVPVVSPGAQPGQSATATPAALPTPIRAVQPKKGTKASW